MVNQDELDDFCREVENFIKTLTYKSELEILIQLMRDFKLEDKLELLVRSFSTISEVSLSLAYIDKRPIINFPFSEHENGIEIGDILFIHKSDVVSKDVHTDPRVKSVYIQAKKSDRTPLVPTNSGEGKQFHLYLNWPLFRLKKPKTIGKFNTNVDVDFNQSTGLSSGLFMKVSEINKPVFLKPGSMSVDISMANFVKDIASDRIGRSILDKNNFSEFTSAVYENAKSNTFIRKTVSKDRMPRVRHPKKIKILNSSGYCSFHACTRSSESFKIGKNKLIFSALKKVLGRLLGVPEGFIWVITLEITHTERPLE